MARIRTVKPEFFSSGSTNAVSPLARLLFIGLWCEADREGRFEWKPRTLKYRYLPGDDVDVDTLLDELIAEEMIFRYGEDGRYACVTNFNRHQVIHREKDSDLPDPSESKEFTDRMRSNAIERDRNTRKEGRNGMERKGMEGNHRDESPSPLPSTHGDSSCPEPARGADSRPPPVLTYPTRGKTKTWDLTEPVVAEMQELYDGIDVLAECKRALAWVKANPDKRKTARGMRRFLNGWIDRSVNRGNASRSRGANNDRPVDRGFEVPVSHQAQDLARTIYAKAESKLLDDATMERVADELRNAQDSATPLESLQKVREAHDL